MHATPDTLLILDFGSQYTQLIARRIREHHVFAEIQAYNKPIEWGDHIKGIILSGSPASVLQPDAPFVKVAELADRVPVLAICYGAQLLTHQLQGKVERSSVREYGRARLHHVAHSQLLDDMPEGSQVWMSHSDSILELPPAFMLASRTADIPVAVFQHREKPVYGLQFHPEVAHTENGSALLCRFALTICRAKPDWSPKAFVQATIEDLREELTDRHVICALSGGVDSSVAAELLHRAIGNRLHCVFVNNGLLRANEYQEVLDMFTERGYNLEGIDASAHFYDALFGIEEPEQKRKAIGRVFIEVFERVAHKHPEVEFLAQGTIYPDVIESVSVNGPSATIKSHHNVGGLPERMKLKVVEPLRLLFKDEVRRVGKELGLPPEHLGRHPFPGPGLAIRIPGEVTPEKVQLLQAADRIFIDALREFDLYHEVWQAFAVLLPVHSVGVMGDERTYENVLALRAVTSVDGMTADWAHLPYTFLAEVSNRIINRVSGINRVVYDISSKPPATIEWE